MRRGANPQLSLGTGILYLMYTQTRPELQAPRRRRRHTPSVYIFWIKWESRETLLLLLGSLMVGKIERVREAPRWWWPTPTHSTAAAAERMDVVLMYVLSDDVNRPGLYHQPRWGSTERERKIIMQKSRPLSHGPPHRGKINCSPLSFAWIISSGICSFAPQVIYNMMKCFWNLK